MTFCIQLRNIREILEGIYFWAVIIHTRKITFGAKVLQCVQGVIHITAFNTLTIANP